MGRNAVTARALRVRVPVLSAHRMSMPAASSTADRLVGSTPRAASERAPIAADRVNMDGRATGIEDSTATNSSGASWTSGMCRTSSA